MTYKLTYEIFSAEAIVETDDALLVDAAEFDEPQWIPKSQIDDDSEVYEDGGKGTLIISEWFAKKCGWL